MWISIAVAAGALVAPVRIAHRSPRFATAQLNADPFRPDRPPIEPMIINAVQSLLSDSNAEADDIAEMALKARNADPDYSLTDSEARLLRRRVLSVAIVRSDLASMLNHAVESTPWIKQFGAAPSFGVGADTDPYARVCRAECMLALLILHVEGGEVLFIDEDRLEVLRDSVQPEQVAALRAALASQHG